MRRRKGVGTETGCLGGGCFFGVSDSDFGIWFIHSLVHSFFSKDSFLCMFSVKMEDCISIRGCSVWS